MKELIDSSNEVMTGVSRRSALPLEECVPLAESPTACPYLGCPAPKTTPEGQRSESEPLQESNLEIRADTRRAVSKHSITFVRQLGNDCASSIAMQRGRVSRVGERDV